MNTLKVLTIRQPWAELIASGLKDIENRSWTVQYRGPIAIHAGKGFEQVSRSHLATILGSKETAAFYAAPQQRGGVIAVAELVDIVTESDSPWFCGPYGWIFRDIRRVPFFPLAGHLWLFDAPVELYWHLAE